MKQVKFSSGCPIQCFLLHSFFVLLEFFFTVLTGHWVLSSICRPVPSSSVWARFQIAQLFNLKLQLLDPSKRGRQRSILNERNILNVKTKIKCKIRNKKWLQNCSCGTVCYFNYLYSFWIILVLRKKLKLKPKPHSVWTLDTNFYFFIFSPWFCKNLYWIVAFGKMMSTSILFNHTFSLFTQKIFKYIYMDTLT